MTIMGSGAARSRTRSHSPRSQTRSIRSSQMPPTQSAPTRRRAGVNPLPTSYLLVRCGAPSMSIIQGSGLVSGRLPPAFEKLTGSRDAVITPS
jgi:hypothetical protein